MKKTIFGLSIGALLLATACGEPSRDERVEDIATVGCDRFDECGEIGSGERYDTYSECISELEGTFYDLWPANQCSEGQINESAFDSCMDRANNYPCNSNIGDGLVYALECGADDVCIDPRD